MSIATFNIRDFGPKKAKNGDVMPRLATIIRSYDIVAVQEISDAAGDVPRLLIDELRRSGAADYRVVVSPRTGQQADDLRSQEQVAFYYNGSSVEPVGEGRLFDDSEHDWFQREPFAARFRSRRGSFSFVLITVHTKPKALEEIERLHDVVTWARGLYADEDDFIVLGDLNAACRYAKPRVLDAMSLRGTGYQWIVPDDADTSLGGGVCAYDRIIVTAGAFGDFTGQWGVNRAFEDPRVSDHWPVWAQFFVGRDR